MPEITKNQIKHIRLLKQKKYRQQYGEFFVEGEKNIAELLGSNFQVETLFTTIDWDNELEQEDVVQLTNKQLSQISNLTTPNKVCAIVKLPKTEFKHSILNDNLTLCLDSINDPGNLGTIIRTADWFGIKNIICSSNSVDCFNPKVVQTTKGSIFNVSVHYQDLLPVLSETDTPIYGAALDGIEMDSDYKIEKPAILLMGSESHGISDDLEKTLNHKLLIKKQGKAESLNVAIATSILLFQLTK